MLPTLHFKKNLSVYEITFESQLQLFVSGTHNM